MLYPLEFSQNNCSSLRRRLKRFKLTAVNQLLTDFPVPVVFAVFARLRYLCLLWNILYSLGEWWRFCCWLLGLLPQDPWGYVFVVCWIQASAGCWSFWVKSPCSGFFFLLPFAAAGWTGHIRCSSLRTHLSA